MSEYRPSHYEDTIGKDAYSPEDLGVLRGNSFQYDDGKRHSPFVRSSAPAVLHAVFINYNVEETLKSEFPELTEATAIGGDFGNFKIEYHFKGIIPNKTVKADCINITKEVVAIYESAGIILNPSIVSTYYTQSKENIADNNAHFSARGSDKYVNKNQGEVENGYTSVTQYFKVISVAKNTFLDKEHKLNNYSFNLQHVNGADYSPREKGNIRKRLSAKLGVPVEKIQLYYDEDGLLNYKVKQ